MFDGPIVETIDDRFDYGETRINVLGEIEGRIFFVTITWRGGKSSAAGSSREESQ